MIAKISQETLAEMIGTTRSRVSFMNKFRKLGFSDFFKALAHESRLVILCLLGGGEKSVMEIADLPGQR